MGPTEPKLAGGLKMKAFYESPYGDDVVTHHMNHHVRGRPQYRMHTGRYGRMTDRSTQGYKKKKTTPTLFFRLSDKGGMLNPKKYNAKNKRHFLISLTMSLLSLV